MKKITSIILAVLMIVSVMALSSCMKPETPESLVNGAIEKTNEYDSYEMDAFMEISMNMLGIEMTVPMDMHALITDAKNENPTSLIDMTVEMLGMSESISMYTEGEWTYFTVAGESYKMSLEDAKEQSGTMDIPTFDNTFTPETFEGVEIIENEDGTKSVELVIPDDKINEVLPGILDSMSGALGTDGEDVKISNIKIKITVSDGLLKKYDMSFDMEMTIEGVSVNASAKYEIEYVKFGDDVVITPPEGYLDFPEYSEY